MNTSDINEIQNQFRISHNNHHKKCPAPISLITCGRSIFIANKPGNIATSYIEGSFKMQNKEKTKEAGRDLVIEGSFRNSIKTNRSNYTNINSSLNASYQQNLLDTKFSHSSLSTIHDLQSHYINKNNKSQLKIKIPLVNNTVVEEMSKMKYHSKPKLSFNKAGRVSTNNIMFKCSLQNKICNPSLRKIKKNVSALITKPSSIQSKSIVVLKSLKDNSNNNTILSNGNLMTLPTESDYFTNNTLEDIITTRPQSKVEKPIKKLVIEIEKGPKLKMKLKKLDKINLNEKGVKLRVKANQLKEDDSNNNHKRNKKQCENIEAKIKEEDIKVKAGDEINSNNDYGIESILNSKIDVNDNYIYQNKNIDDNLDDMKTIIRKINFNKITMNSTNIFSNDNDVYRRFSIKFNDAFEKQFNF